VLASSTGGPKALTTFFSQIEPGFGAPILVAQHMPTGFTATLAQRLSQCGPMAVREAANGDLVRPGEALICPGGQHMFYLPDGRVRIEDGPALHGVKPAADHLFLSAARCLGSRTVGVVLTGMGRDGADGSVAVRKAGGVVFGECEESCTVYGMPRAAKQAGGIDEEFPVEQIPARLLKAVMREARRAS
jgi:two-component system, chemotaxis family, protein-glutamate methylesterase/glutaminase